MVAEPKFPVFAENRLIYQEKASFLHIVTKSVEPIFQGLEPIADVAISKRPLLFTVWTQLRLRSHQNFYEIFTRKQFLPTSVGNAQAQSNFCG